MSIISIISIISIFSIFSIYNEEYLFHSINPSPAGLMPSG